MALTPGTLTVMLDAAWRVTLVLAVAWGATRLLGRRPAARAPRGLGNGPAGRAGGARCSPDVLPSWRVAVLPAPTGARRRALVAERAAFTAEAASDADCHCRDARAAGCRADRARR